MLKANVPFDSFASGSLRLVLKCAWVFCQVNDAIIKIK
jgi:hypothetical protein